MRAVDGEPEIGAEQWILPGLGPALGSRWRNRNTRSIVTVLAVDQRRFGWVTIRTLAGPATITLARFERAFEPHQPPREGSK